MPRNGTITSIAVYFSVTSVVGVGIGDYIIHAQLFRSDTPDNIFEPLVTTDISLTPSFVGPTISLGEIATGSISVDIPITIEDRLLLVFFVEPPTASVASSIIGYASAGITIE